MFDKFNKLVKLILEQITGNNDKITQIPCKYRNTTIKWTDKQEEGHAEKRYDNRATQINKNKKIFYSILQKGIDKFLDDPNLIYIRERKRTTISITSLSNNSIKIKAKIIKYNNHYLIILITTLNQKMKDKFSDYPIQVQNKEKEEYNIIVD